MKKLVEMLALEAGGSHYPAVGGDNLQRFANLMLAYVTSKLHREITQARVHDQVHTAQVLEAVLLETLSEFDVES